jgi:hypothetical protein
VCKCAALSSYHLALNEEHELLFCAVAGAADIAQINLKDGAVQRSGFPACSCSFLAFLQVVSNCWA